MRVRVPEKRADVLEPEVRLRVVVLNAGSRTIRDKLIEHRRYIREQGEDLPEVRNWTWKSADAGARPTPPAERGWERPS